MKSYRVITLFTPPLPPPRRGSLSVAASVLAHIAGCVWLFLGLSHTPRLDGKSTLQRFTVRVLQVPPPEPQIEAPVVTPAAAAPTHPSLPREVARNVPPGNMPAPMTSPASLPSPAPMAPAASILTKLTHQNQTLIQPDAPPDVVLQHKTPVPTVFMWTPANVPIKPVIAAPMQKPILAKLRPSIEPPNRELNVADMRMSSTQFNTALHALPPSTTSPVVVRGPDEAKPQLPATASKPAAEPTPARVLSLSDLQAQEGPVAIPLANATARPTAGESISAGRGEKPADAGHGTSASTQAGSGAGHASAAPAVPSEKASTGSGAGTQASANSGPPQEAAGAGGAGLQGPVTHVTLPKDGQYGVVVVGTSLADKYPETVDIWSGRLVYTVYLHVGAGKNWILQYSLPPGSAVAAAAAGTRPDAPWPYDIVRPRFDPDDFNSDALMVHGFVNSAGRFERLALVFPAEFAKVKFLLSALQQWEFRPARENGQTAAVEVLLIIPEEME